MTTKSTRTNYTATDSRQQDGPAQGSVYQRCFITTMPFQGTFPVP